MAAKSTTRTRNDHRLPANALNPALPIGDQACGSGAGIGVWVVSDRNPARPLDVGASLVSAVAYCLWHEFGDDPCANWSEAERIVASIVVPEFLKPSGESK